MQDLTSETTAPSAQPPSGSGYADLDGTVINYTYGGFSGFQFAVFENKIRWRGVDRYFLGICREVVPQISKVGDNVYFSSWSTGGNGGDNVVHNFNTMEVNAHLNPDDSDPDTLEMIHGVIHCWNKPDCIYPEGELTSDEDLFPMIQRNMEEQNLPPLFDPAKNNQARSSADRAARAELTGLSIEYNTADGTTRIDIDGDTTSVSANAEAPRSLQTFATKIDDGIYFISWLGDHGGNHIVINRLWRKVFRHISPQGERAEAIYDLIYFSSAT